jgi:hypothetical protein
VRVNYGRIAISGAAATIVFFLYGFLVHGWLIAGDYTPYPEGVYRGGDAARTLMPFALIGVFIAILVFAAIYARGYQGGRGVVEGSRQGLLFGIFMAGAFVGVNYATINISGKLALELAASELVEWTLVGIVVGWLYKPFGAER